eukprot:1450677-Pleurochrysis_carterae.AAC.3
MLRSGRPTGSAHRCTTDAHPMGVPQPGGGLPATVVRANAIAANCTGHASRTRHTPVEDTSCCFESLVARGASSRFAIEGKGEHVYISTHDDPSQLASADGVGCIYFDQFMFGAPSPRTTQLIASRELLALLSHTFSE